MAAHSARVAVLVAFLVDPFDKDTPEIMLAALLHDAPESECGDIGRMAKLNNPLLRQEAFRCECEWHKRNETEGLLFDHIVLKLCDSLDAVLWVASIAPYILAEQEWQDHIAEVERMSWGISADVAAKVTGLLQAGGVR